MILKTPKDGNLGAALTSAMEAIEGAFAPLAASYRRITGASRAASAYSISRGNVTARVDPLRHAGKAGSREWRPASEVKAPSLCKRRALLLLCDRPLTACALHGA